MADRAVDIDDSSVWLRRSDEGFVFASDFDRETTSERYGIGIIVRATMTKPRSGKHNRWYRALVRTVWKHQDFYKSPDALHLALKFRLGLVDQIVLHNGEGVLIPKSTSYDQMDQGEFRAFVDRTFDIVATEIIPGLDKRGQDGLAAEVDRLIAGPLAFAR